ncbi:MAG: glutamate mutase L, partial [Defluviitaleaceae bacterium]|nr:glutamate mutase L [Defluviitaleaceae bacterium]
EGDLGVFVNIPHIVEKIGMDDLQRVFPNARELIDNAAAIPKTDEQKRFIEHLTKTAAATALERHAGKLTDFYGPNGKKTLATGKDLTAIKYLIGTGGALTRLPARKAILESLPEPSSSTRLTPRRGARALIDNDYIMASLGVLSLVHREAALELMMGSLDK